MAMRVASRPNARPAERRVNLGRDSRSDVRVEGGLSADLDASVLLPTLISEPTTEAVYDWPGVDGQELLISHFVAAAVASALSRLVTHGPAHFEADASAGLADFDAWRAAMSSQVDIAVSDARLAYILSGASISGSERPTRCISRIARRPRCDRRHA